MTFLNIYSTNISSLLAEKEIGNTLLSGIIIAIYLMSGFICGLLFDKMNRIFKSYTFSIGILMSAIGLVLLYFAENEIILIVGSLISGYGMGQTIPASLNIASQYSNKQNETFHISMILSGSRIGQFLTTLVYIPLLVILQTNIAQSYLLAGVVLIVLFVLVIVFEKVMVK